MSLSVPKFILNAFAKSGLKNTIPEIADPVTGDAGYTEGFPAITMQQKTAGGIPPKGQDFNGVLFDITSAIQYTQAGCRFPFNQAFASAIGGYPKGAVVSGLTDQSVLYRSTIDANLAAPPSAGWAQFSVATPTETTPGIPRVATQAEANNGILDDVVITPKKLRAGFSAQLAGSGFVAFPTWLGGFIIQWGIGTASPSGTANNFPTAFPSAPYVSVCCHIGLNPGSAGATSSVGLSSAQVRFFNAGPDQSVQVVYISIGK